MQIRPIRTDEDHRAALAKGLSANKRIALPVIASDSEAIQTKPQLETLVWVASLCSR